MALEGQAIDRIHPLAEGIEERADCSKSGAMTGCVACFTSFYHGLLTRLTHGQDEE